MEKLGYDIGSSSIGWCFTVNGEIAKKGVVRFDSGMSKEQAGYVSPTKERREARSKRNLIRARKYRKWDLLEILVEEYAPLNKIELEVWSKYKKRQIKKFPENEKFLKWLACDFTYEGGIKYKNPYDLRVTALDNPLSKDEFGRVLYHLIQRRGYKDIGESDSETEKQIARRGEGGFQKALDSNRTIAEALVNDFLSKNKRARNQYPYRDEYEYELEKICEAQGYDITKTNKGKYNDKFVQRLWNAIIWQRPLRSQKGNIGKCILEPSKLRCPISHPVFEIFRAWQFINTIKYYDKNEEKQNILQDYREQLFEFFLRQEKNFKFEEIRKFLDKKFGKAQKYNYPINKKGIYNTSVSGMPVCKGFVDVFGNIAKEAISDMHHYNMGNAPKIIRNYSLNDLWHILFSFDEKESENIFFLKEFAISKLGINNEIRKDKEINPFAKLKGNLVKGYSDLSYKAICKIIPFLKMGYLYNEAVVLAKIPDLLGEKWDNEKETIFEIVQQSNEIYNWNKIIIGITNNLIDRYKGLNNNELFAYKDYEYKLDDSDIKDIEEACNGYFGEKSWAKRINKVVIIDSVRKHYQEFFHDAKRAYQKLPLLTDIFNEQLQSKNIEIVGDLYHHSDRENIYGNVDTDKKTGLEILPEARIDSIKNPMFNKSMSILRKLTNMLIKDGVVDSDTEVVVELARELNDNNMRIAIERYQNKRRDTREKYRMFLEEFKEQEQSNINVEENIPIFEMWTEQIFEETENEEGKVIKNRNNGDILKENEEIRRYELWMEQRGQCLYSGKMISITQLFSNEIDIEHTIPRSILPDNTMANQTVAYAWYNRDKKKKQLPKQCDNYSIEKEGWGTAIEPRIANWIEKREHFKTLYEGKLKPRGNEDENAKNKRIQDKHYLKMHYDYWKDKVERFDAEEVKDSWARRQLVDTQMISKYAREYLKTYFKKVSVQKGSTTANFRKIYGFQSESEIKSRNKHTHHAIDALVLTLIPVNSSRRDRILKEYYKALEDDNKTAIKSIKTRELPVGFNSQSFINEIENTTLIVNYEKDNILKQTKKTVRKRGKIQYLKDKKGNFIFDENGKKIKLKAKGDTIRSTLYAQTYLGKIREVERDDFEKEIKVEKLNLDVKVRGLPVKHQNNDWVYKHGKEEFSYVVRKPIKDVLSKIDDIVDPCIKELIRKQKNNAEIKDYQGNIIRHVRIKVKAGKEVKERINYRSKHEHKNKFYSESGSIPYAVLLQKGKSNKYLNADGNILKESVDREMITIPSFEIAKTFKKAESFDLEHYIKEFYSQYSDWNKTLMKVGQKVFVLTNDSDYERINDVDFLMNRMYVITQFSEGSIWLKYHLTAQSKDEIKMSIKEIKDKLLYQHEKTLGIPEIVEDGEIKENKERKEDYETKKYRFDTINAFRFGRLSKIIGEGQTKKIKQELDKYKAIASKIEIDGETPLLKMSKENWNFLFEGIDFKVKLDGTIIFNTENE